MTHLWRALGAVIFFILTLTPGFAAKRALVIGIDHYPNLPPRGQLQKAVNDARSVGAALAEIGFSVTRIENASKSEISRALGVLEQTVAAGDTVFLFFAGHGIEINGTNYLLPGDLPSPLDANGHRLPERAFRDASFNATEVLSSLQAQKAGVVIGVFDACREPFDDAGKRSLNLNVGLTDMKPAQGMFIMFSAGAKQLALDSLFPSDANPNSIFTREFVSLVKRPDLSLVGLAKELQPRVQELAASVAHVQTPAYYDQIVGNFFLAQPVVASFETHVPLSVKHPASQPPDEREWVQIRDTGNALALYKFLETYPSTTYRSDVEKKIERLAQRAWKNIDQEDPTALRNFFTAFPDSPLSAQANQKLVVMEATVLPLIKEPFTVLSPSKANGAETTYPRQGDRSDDTPVSKLLGKKHDKANNRSNKPLHIAKPKRLAPENGVKRTTSAPSPKHLRKAVRWAPSRIQPGRPAPAHGRDEVRNGGGRPPVLGI
jgi:hypothetical protein